MADMTKSNVGGASDAAANPSDLTVLSFRKLDEMKRLATHFLEIMRHPLAREKETLYKYLKNLNETHMKIFLEKREGVEVEYIFTTEKKSSLQRQRFNSLPVSDVPELLKAELLNVENAKQVHICTDCNVEIELHDEEPLMESLQKHFNLDVHLPKMKRESIDVSEPIHLPNMSRRLSAMAISEVPAHSLEQFAQSVKTSEKMERPFTAKLEAAFVRHLPDNSEAGMDAALKYYQGAFDKLCRDISTVDFAALTSSVAPIIMSIKDNVNQNFAADANKNYENEENEPNADKAGKNQAKKYRYYGCIESLITNLLAEHKLLTLIDDRTGKLAFFCMSCEFYTLRFRYDSVLNHVFSDTHIHNLASILRADRHISFSSEDRSVEKIKEINREYMLENSVTEDENGFGCGLCKVLIESMDAAVLHLLEENHLGKLSDKFFRKLRDKSADAIPDEWGPKSLDWVKYLATNGKPLNSRDHVVIENFIKPSGKIANYCSCCDMALKGPRQVLFNHIRQKKHLRNAAPHKLAMLYRNYCRPFEYYASFGNYYVCALCPEYVAMPSFAGILEHVESKSHIDAISGLVCMALYPDVKYIDQTLLDVNKISVIGKIRCDYCDVSFTELHEAMTHVLSSVQHHNTIVEEKVRANRGDIISAYMQGNYVLHSEGSTFTCDACKGVFNSIRSLLSHLVYANHFKNKPTTENVFRFYLELKHNINMLARNKYVYQQFGRLRCGVCDAELEEDENAKKHVVSPRHRENMGAGVSVVHVNLDMSAAE